KPSYDRKTLNLVKDLLSQGKGASEISKMTGLSRQAVLRIRDRPEAAEEALVRWGR
ncbi:MAG: helix-turn-helix domain-containing protein, partial [Marivivens sp.]|nr:helix-turn-helix domain-containing protein [Marivivens sp.]